MPPRKLKGRGDEASDEELANLFGRMHLPMPAPVVRPPAPAPVRVRVRAPNRQAARAMFEPPPAPRAAPPLFRPRVVGKKSTREGERYGNGICKICGGKSPYDVSFVTAQMSDEELEMYAIDDEHLKLMKARRDYLRAHPPGGARKR